MDKFRRSGKPGGGKKDSFKKKFDDKKRDGKAGAKGKNERPFRKRGEEERGERPFRRKDGEEKSEKPFRRKDSGERNERPFRKREGESSERGKFSGDNKFKSRKDSFSGGRDKDFKDKRSFRKKDYDDKDGKKFSSDRKFGSKRSDSFSEEGDARPKKSFRKKEYPDKKERGFSSDRKYGRDKDISGERSRYSGDKKSFHKKDYADKGDRKFSSDRKFGRKKDMLDTERAQVEGYEKKSFNKSQQDSSGSDLIRLNKYLSNAGIASRREADVLIKSGAVKVNGQVITEMGHKIKPGDTVTYGDAPVKSEKKVYLLLNKPKDYITTVEDDRDRRTVMDLIAGACRERVYPVGRLDRNTTGVLLLTNDGELTKKLTHPKFGIRKVYHVTLNRGLKVEDFSKIIEGVELEDGIIKADDLAFTGESKKEIGIEIHSGRNRIVRRLFEHLGYDVIKLDRVVFAGLTKKDLPRGRYRFLNQKEVNFLRMIG